MEYLAYYCFTGLGVWLGLSAIRLKQDGLGYFSLLGLKSVLLGFIGAILVWPILIFYVEV